MKKKYKYEIRMDNLLTEAVSKNSMNKPTDNNDTIKIFINGYPWYLKKHGDSTHFVMTNNEKAVNDGTAMVHHVGQHRGEPYYKDIVDWLHNKIISKALNGKHYNGSK